MCESARLDGASEWQVFTRIVLPLSTPVLATVTVFTFLWAWNDFTGPLLFLNSPRNFTMALSLQDFQGQHMMVWKQMMAAATVFPSGQAVRLCGFNIGGWLNMEDFIGGFVGVEHNLRATMCRIIGKAKAEFFFDRFRVQELC